MFQAYRTAPGTARTLAPEAHSEDRAQSGKAGLLPSESLRAPSLLRFPDAGSILNDTEEAVAAAAVSEGYKVYHIA